MTSTDLVAFETASMARVERTPAIEAVARRALDIVVSGTLLLLALPLLIVIALAIRLESKGNPLFRQHRLGRNGRPFVVHKFRSMRSGANSERHRDYVASLIAAGNEADSLGRGGLYKLAVDDRVTRVGAFLRKWSLDELPQLLDVLRGRMSLVGPRPVIAYEVEHYPAWYMKRFAVNPGLTGLWQVSGRNERTYEEMIALDCEYVETRSFWLDIKILLKTVGVVVRRQGVA